jgi:hypothetical protein
MHALSVLSTPAVYFLSEISSTSTIEKNIVSPNIYNTQTSMAECWTLKVLADKALNLPAKTIITVSSTTTLEELRAIIGALLPPGSRGFKIIVKGVELTESTMDVLRDVTQIILKPSVDDAAPPPPPRHAETSAVGDDVEMDELSQPPTVVKQGRGTTGDATPSHLLRATAPPPDEDDCKSNCDALETSQPPTNTNRTIAGSDSALIASRVAEERFGAAVSSQQQFGGSTTIVQGSAPPQPSNEAAAAPPAASSSIVFHPVVKPPASNASPILSYSSVNEQRVAAAPTAAVVSDDAAQHGEAPASTEPPIPETKVAPSPFSFARKEALSTPASKEASRDAAPPAPRTPASKIPLGRPDSVEPLPYTDDPTVKKKEEEEEAPAAAVELPDVERAVMSAVTSQVQAMRAQDEEIDRQIVAATDDADGGSVKFIEISVDSNILQFFTDPETVTVDAIRAYIRLHAPNLAAVTDDMLFLEVGTVRLTPRNIRALVRHRTLITVPTTPVGG